MANIGDILTEPERGWTRFDADDNTSRRGAGWQTTNSRLFTGGSVYFTTVIGSYLVFQFSGSRFRLISEFHSQYDSNVELMIDGGPAEYFSINDNKTFQPFSLAYEKTELEDTVHTVTIKMTSGTFMNVDAIDLGVEGEMLPAPVLIGDILSEPQRGWLRVDSEHPYYAYLGTGWSVGTNAAYYGGSRHQSANNTLECTLRFVFKGSKLRLISSYSPGFSSQLEMSIDGHVEPFSLSYANANRVMVYEKRGLADTEHMVEIKKLANGGSNPDFTFDAVDIDEEGYIRCIQGSQLIVPENGWRRFDDTDPGLTYSGPWTTSAVDASNRYGGTFRYSTNPDAALSFTFYGSQLRVIAYRELSASNDVVITIDNQEYRYSNWGSVSAFNNSFEIMGLELGEHVVTISTAISGKQINVDAIDIDEPGYLVSPVNYPATGGELRYSIAEMKIGDFIPCGYRTAAPNTAGMFYRLGSQDKEAELPLDSATVPYGFFYFIKVKEGVLIADRPIQHGVSWLMLNNSLYTHGTKLTAADNPIMTSNIHPYGVASASSTYSKDYEPYMAFDGKDAAYGWLTKSGEKSGWLEYEFPLPVIIQKYSLKAPTTNTTIMPSQWTLEAWDGAKWTVLDARAKRGWLSYEECDYVFGNITAYKKYRIYIEANDGHANFSGIGELRLYKEPARTRIRMLNGGTAFADSQGNPSSSNRGFGIYPVHNEWDLYLGKGAFSKPEYSDGETVWRFSGVDAEWTQDTVRSGVTSLGTGLDTSGNGRTIRGKGAYDDVYWSVAGTYTTQGKIGFRPIVEYEFD